MNKVDFLLENKFSLLTLSDKLEIKNLGRPLPTLNLTQNVQGGKQVFVRRFHMNIYQRNQWICGCDKKNLLFCFPCLLFSSDKDAWSKNGVGDLSHLSQKIRKHQTSEHHLNAVLNLSVLGKTNISVQLSKAYRKSVEEFNEQVKKNRYVLSKIIDCVKFCGEFELALRGHDETENSDNKGIFRELIDFTSALDKILQEHFEKSTVFKGTSKCIQNDILDCMLEVSREMIKSEISECDYISVIADETTDVSAKFQLSVILRYVVKSSGKPVERFWTFMNPLGHDATSLANCIKEVLSEVIGDQKKKLIAQSYDGASVMSGKNAGVQSIIREEYPNAHFVHCYAHQLNLIMSKAGNQNYEVRAFFANISEITSFFSHSTQRVQILDDVVGTRLPTNSATRWNFNSRAIQTIFENKEALLECFANIAESSHNQITVNSAMSLQLKIQQSSFIFWLEFFYKIMPHVDIMFKNMQSRNITSGTAKVVIESFLKEVSKIRADIDTMNIQESAVETNKRRKTDHYLSKNVAAKEVCDLITNQATDRFQFVGHLVMAKLFDFDKFAYYSKCFPDHSLEEVTKCYPFLDKTRLKTELRVIYEREDFRTVKKTTDLLGFLKENNVTDCFCEVVKCLHIIITTPMTSSEAERSFSCLKRIKTFLRSTMVEDRLTALAMVSMEKEIATRKDFNEKVIEKFSRKKERRMDFLFKEK